MFVMIATEAILSCFRPPFRFGLLLQQMEFIGVGSLGIIFLTGTFAGAVFTLQSLYAFSLFNMESMVGATVALALTRELSPVLASLMITGRAGAKSHEDLTDPFVEFLLAQIATDRLAPLKIVANPGNGCAGPLLTRTLKSGVPNKSSGPSAR